MSKDSKLTKFYCSQNKSKTANWSDWWWYYPTPSEEWGRGGTPRRPNSRATPQGLDQRSKMEVVPKIARRKGSDAGQSRRRLVKSCRECPQALHTPSAGSDSPPPELSRMHFDFSSSIQILFNWALAHSFIWQICHKPKSLKSFPEIVHYFFPIVWIYFETKLKVNFLNVFKPKHQDKLNDVGVARIITCKCC